MKVGIDTFSIRELSLDRFEQLDWIKDHDFDGAQFGNVGVDAGKLNELRSHADSLGLYSHVSVTTPNPHLAPSTIEEKIIALTEQIEAAAAAGWRELHSSLGSDANRYRHESVAWKRQLEDSVAVIDGVAPVLRANGSRINLEPHFDTTTFELVEIIEKVGADVCGVCLDTANVMLFGEHPIEAIKRVAPYTHLTHTKDAFLFFGDSGLRRQTCPPGRGAIDWRVALPILHEPEPDLPLSIEDHKWLFGAEIFEDWWHYEQPHLSRRELAMTVELAWMGQREILAGSRPDPDEYDKIPYEEELEERLHFGRDHLKTVLKELKLDD